LYICVGRRGRKKLIIAVEVYKNSKDFNCASCGHKHCDQDKQLSGSKGPAGFFKWEVQRGGQTVIESKVCLLPMITQRSHGLMKLYKQYLLGHYPYSGGLYEQPNAYLQAIEIIGN